MILLQYPQLIIFIVIAGLIILTLGFKVDKLTDSVKEAYWIGFLITVVFDLALISLFGKLIDKVVLQWWENMSIRHVPIVKVVVT